VPITEAMNWVGVENPTVAAKVFSSAGIPSKAMVEGARITKLQMEHTWTEAYLNYDSYRGVDEGGNGAKSWVPLDTAFKQYEYKKALDIAGLVPFDAKGFVEQMIASTSVDNNTGAVSNIDEQLIQDNMANYQSRGNDYLSTNYPNINPDDLSGKKTIIKEELGLLPNSLPTNVTDIVSEWDKIPAAKRAGLSISIAGLNYTTSLPELASKSITLSFIGATDTDKDILHNYQSIDEVPTYLVKMVPVLKIGGKVVKVGSLPLPMATDENLSLSIKEPNNKAEIINNLLTVSGYYSVNLDLGRIAKQDIKLNTEHLSTATNKLKALADKTTTTVALNIDSVIGELLHLSGAVYFAQLDAASSISASMAGVLYQRDVSESITGLETKVNTVFGAPIALNTNGFFFDVDGDNFLAVAKDGSKQKTKAFANMAGVIGSYLEGITYPKLFGVPGEGVSAVSLLRLANSKHIPIYTITKDNAPAIDRLTIPAALKQELQNQVAQGMQITIPERQLTTANGWQGIGYIVADPLTGSAGYMISGGMAGGVYTGLGIAADAMLRNLLLINASIVQDTGLSIIGSMLLSVVNIVPFIEVLGTFVFATQFLMKSKLSKKNKMIYFAKLKAITIATLSLLLVLLPLSITPNGGQYAAIMGMWFTSFTYTVVFGAYWPILIESAEGLQN